MFLIVKQSDNTIIGNAIKPIDISEASKKGYLVFEIDDTEFKADMLGSKIESFDFKD
jgi:hypothetical protein